MSHHNRVVWSEGLFLRPQHFQQSERFLECWVRHSVQPGFPYGYGFTHLELDQELLKIGKVGVRAAAGIMPDGTPFTIPEDCPAPAPLDVSPACKDTEVMLALPLRRAGLSEMAFEVAPVSGLPRYVATDVEIADNGSVNQSIAEMRVGQLSFRLVLASDPIDAYGTLSVARVQEYNSSRAVTLDTSHIIPCLDCTASGVLRDYLREISGLLTHRAVSLAARLGQPGQRGVAEVTDYLILQIANRYDPLFRHLLTRALMHPEMLYRLCLQIAGELSTYTQAKHRPVDFPSYRHDALRETFAPLMASLRDALTAVLDQRAVPIKIEDLGNSVYRASIPDTDLLRSGNFVLAVNAQMSSEKLRRDFPNQVKLGPQDKLRDLVMSHLPGIGLIAQPVAPRQLPYHAGFTYFELDRSSGLWKEIEKSRVLALHVAGDFPELQMELWGIRS